MALLTPLTRNDSLVGVDFEAGAVLLVNKPPGMTSFGAVRRVRKIIGVRKVGHTGTLDPAATGLLILLTGQATRRQREFMALEKEYLATILLGLQTKTLDLDGEIIARSGVPIMDREELADLLANRFRGEIEQVPPAFSAVKQKGVPSYRLARRGQSVALKPRKVTVSSIEIEAWAWPEFTLRLRCSSGFYVRSLAHDIGQAIGCGGTLKKLVRTAVGLHRLDEALDLDDLAAKLLPCQH